ncbi:hypothetical protein H6F76_26885 [Leptolyngbya sp. FACHB-321]|uniref:hypothetical protein n=1 Tax=Leptolyngbya sp. FACHB-321 TaxID=2692807 RepID=UPI0016860251|nr:hypothetical protein [Leptolyngbya sp. FACHB-321]MBD2038584.1 hypothetical protein [Leptolyngbya sp. FACHB-321]
MKANWTTFEAIIEKYKIKPSSILSLILTILGISYLLAILFGTFEKDRFGTAEVAIFAAILLLNSNLIERLAEFQFSKDGLTLKLKEVQAKQGEIENRVEEIVGFLAKNFLDANEHKQLIRFTKKGDFDYTEKNKRQTFQNELRRLRDLGLIESVSGGYFSVGNLPDQHHNLKELVRITPTGLKYLEYIGQTSKDSIQDDGENPTK